MKIRQSLLHAAALAAFILAMSAIPARAVIIGEDDFDYADGPLAGKSGGFFWNWRNRTPAARTTGGPSDWDNLAGAPAVIGGRLVTAGSSVTREYNGPGEGSSVDINRDDGLGAINNFSSGDISFQEHVVYYRVTLVTGATLPVVAGVSAYDFSTERVFFGKTFNSNVFGIGLPDGTVASSSITVQPNTAYTLVAKLDYVTSMASLFVNPDLSAATEPAPTVSRSFDTANWTTAVRLASDGAPSVTWDDLTVCTKWSDLAPVVVNTDADADNGFLGGGSGISLREAVKYAPEGSRITFAPGLSGKTITLTHGDGDMPVPEALTIDATALPGGLTVDANNASRHFELPSGKSLTLRGLKLIKGNGSGGDGGSIFSDGRLVLDRCTISGNTAAAPGFNGGAVFSGGANGSLRAVDCTFADNSVPSSQGGGIFVSGTAVELARCTLSGNTADDAGGIWLQGPHMTLLDHCTLFRNRATGSGAAGGIASTDGTLTLRHCTIAQNIGNGSGGGVYLQSPATVNLDSCLIAGNSNSSGSGPADIDLLSGTLNTTGKNLIGSNQTVEAKFPAGPLAGTAAAPLDPQLGLADFYGGLTKMFSLKSGSPAREAATGSTATADQRGFPMVGTPDLGAYEVQFSAIPDITVAAGTATISFPFTVGQVGTLSAVSQNEALVTSGNIVLSGSGSSRSATFTLTPGQSGTAGILFLTSLGDGVSFNLTVEEGPPPDLVVTSTADSGPGSLREKIALAAGHGGPDTITFAPGFTGPIVLSSELTLADTSGSLVIDADSVTGGLTLDANNKSRHFTVPAGNALGLSNITLTRGNGGGGSGGSINNLGTVFAERCVFTDNKAQTAGSNGGAVANSGSDAAFEAKDCSFTQNSVSHAGGGIYLKDGKAVLARCTLSGNTAERAGAVWLEGNSTAGLDRCTLIGNKGTGGTAGNAGGGIGCVSGELKLSHCTLTGNSGTNGGGLHMGGTSTGKFADCIIAGNSDSGGGAADIRLSGGTLTGLDQNLIGNNQSVETEFPAGPLTGTATAPLDAKLAPLDNYGGLTQTRALRPGSPARNAAPDSKITSDQRGFPMVSTPDLGAYEAGNQVWDNFLIYSQETLPATATDAQRAPAFDYDGDGQTNQAEWLTGTAAESGASFFVPRLMPSDNGQILLFSTVSGRRYFLEQSDTLAVGSWGPSPLGNPLNGDGATAGWTLPKPTPGGLPPGVTRRFYRVRIDR